VLVQLNVKPGLNISDKIKAVIMHVEQFGAHPAQHPQEFASFLRLV